VVVAVTGATGFVGRHLTALFLQRGHRVRALVRDLPRAQFLRKEGAELVAGSLDEDAALTRLLAGADAAVHLVGIIVEWGRATFAAVHVDGTARVVNAARAAGVRRFIHMSALSARPDADATAYHRTKWQAEELVRGSGLPAAILRPSLISGPESAPIRTLARMHRWSPLIPVFGDGRFPTQPVWIHDVAMAFALALERADVMGTFELGGPAGLAYEEFVRAIGRASGHPRPLVHIPMTLVRWAARACDPLGPAAPITSIQLRMLIEGTSTPSNAIETVFGIRPLPFEEGLRRFLR
jgi:NADH dehydrogenase